MIQELTDILSQIPEEQKQGLEESVRDLVLTEESTVELKMGGGAFPDEGLFSISVNLIVKHGQFAQGGQLTLQHLIERITVDAHGDSDKLLSLFREHAGQPLSMTYIKMGEVTQDVAMLHMSIDAPLKAPNAQPQA